MPRSDVCPLASELPTRVGCSARPQLGRRTSSHRELAPWTTDRRYRHPMEPAFHANSYDNRSGIASPNSILLVTLAREHREATGCSGGAGGDHGGPNPAGPVLMTAGAMFVGMLPMLLGFAEGSGECDPR
jgi:AcrB/AcrD/AcrF family